jgi:type I restriction enzyme M protein
MLIEAKTPEEFKRYRDLSIREQLFAIAKQEIKGPIRPRYFVYYTVKIEQSALRDDAVIIDFEQYPTYEEWKEGGEATLDEIPAEYGVAKKYFYANIDNPDQQKGWRPLRKDYGLSDFEKLRVPIL